MDSKNLTPRDNISSSEINKGNNIKIKDTLSFIFKDRVCSGEYLEIISLDQKFIKIIFRNNEEIISKHSEFAKFLNEKLNEFKEITLIFDFQRLSFELETDDLKKIIDKFNKNITNIDNTKLSIIIKNCYVNPQKILVPIIYQNKLILNKLEIEDELYSLTTKLGSLFQSLQVNELILKKLKFNSKTQLSNFCKFIQSVDCKILTLEDIFIELILKKDDDDEEYKDLDIYFSYLDGVITLDNMYTGISSLTLRDCPLFAIEGDIFNYKEQKEFAPLNRNIDIDENSLINPFIITRFKIKNKKYDICFDLDSFKLKLEEKGDKNTYDYIDYLDYIFNIIISFQREGQKIINDKKKWNDIDDGLGDINRKHFHRLTFKNFDITKLEYVYNDDLTFIKEKDWILNKEEKERKKRWEDLENSLINFEFTKLSDVKELVFDNCSNFFIKWVLHFIKGKTYEIKSLNDDLNLLKIKKCGKDYIDLNNFLTMKIKNVILFDSPLIIPNYIDNKNKNELQLNYIDGDFRSIENLTIKINSLDCYGKQYNLNTYNTLKILVELIQKFNKRLTFELSSLSNIMTFLAFKKYFEDQNFYNDSNEDENGDDNIYKDNLKGINNENKIKEIPNYLPKHIFFSSKKKRDFIYTKAFNLQNFDENSVITLKNLTIKKTTENFDNQNYLMIKNRRQMKSYTDNNELKKIDFGSDGFFIDRDYKNFISENRIGTVELINVSFSNYKDNNLKDIEEETIVNLISNNDSEEQSIIDNKYKETFFPNYKIDVKTLNGVLYKNFLFEDIGIMFKYFMYTIDTENVSGNKYPISMDMYEKKKTLMEYFIRFKKIFECFKNNIKKLTIIINNIKELKEFYCTLCVLRVLVKAENWIKEEVSVQGSKNRDIAIELPSKKKIENEIENYFIKEKNEEGKECYSEINYYYSSFEEKIMVKNKKIIIGENIFYIESQFEDIYFEEV